jgi:hypothetical protein
MLFKSAYENFSLPGKGSFTSPYTSLASSEVVCPILPSRL